MAKNHPYIGKPDYQFWNKEPAIATGEKFDPIVKVSFSLDAEEPIATAGSCFAQHVAKELQRVGFNYLVTETPHPIIPQPIAEKYHYGAFTARYGNLYTARQLRQLLERAYGRFDPVERAWVGAGGALVDPFRPQIHPGGFINDVELEADRTKHLAAVRTAIESLSCFVFTLGLTEAWVDRRDGAVFPLAPGVAGGSFDPDLYAFKNFTVAEVIEDMQWSLAFIRQVNPAAKFILTVSPVPLNATYMDRHVFVSTVYSKSVLRVAAEALTEVFDNCDYFPSFEIVNNPYHRERFFAEDCREVRPEGVAYVMKLFLKHYANLDVDLIEGEASVVRREAAKSAKAIASERKAEREERQRLRAERQRQREERVRQRELAKQEREERRRQGQQGRRRPDGKRAEGAPGSAQARKQGGQTVEPAGKASKQADDFLEEMKRLNDILCDEESISNS